MTGRRPLAALLGELADGIAGFGASGPVRARSVSMRLPIDLRLVQADGGYELIGDVPLFRTRTEFDPEPAQLELEWHAIGPEAQP
jgi:hypothetical protein